MSGTPDGIRALVLRAGFDWAKLPGIFQDDLTDDWNESHTYLDNAKAVQRIRSLLGSIAPEAELDASSA